MSRIPAGFLTAAVKSPFLPYEQIVSSSGHYAADMLAAPTTSQVQLQGTRACITGGQPAGYFRLGYTGYGGPLETPVTNPYTIEASIWIPTAPNPGPFHVKWTGATTRAVQAAENALSDRLLATAFGYAVAVPPGTLYYIKENLLAFSSGAAGAYPIIGGANWGTVAPETGTAQYYSPVTASQCLIAGVTTLPAGGAAAAAYPPLVAIIGAFTAPEVSLLMIGDSIMQNAKDVRNMGVTTVGGGVFVRPTYGVNGRNIPWCNLGIGGDTASGYAANSALRKFWYKYGTHAVCDFGTNDLGTLSHTAAQVRTDLHTIWAAIKAGGITRLDQSQITPRTTSTDNWTLLANQMAVAGYANGGARDTLNTDIIADVGTNGLDGTISLALAVEDPSDHTKWMCQAISTGTITGGSGYTNGTYNNVPLTILTGAGVGPVAANVTVAGGAVTVVSIGVAGTTANGHGFAVGDTLSSASIGPGTGFVWTVSALQSFSRTPDGLHPQRYSFLNGNPSACDLIAALYETYLPAATTAPAVLP